MVLQLQEVPFLVRAIGTLLKIYWRMELSFSYESLLVEKNIYIYIYILQGKGAQVFRVSLDSIEEIACGIVFLYLDALILWDLSGA